jgi:glutamate/tyrosine decarboxylase-like PLP-dependent enzyme
MDDQYKMDITALKSLILSDIQAGLTPFMVIASAGTTDTGSIDPLDAIADLCDQHDIWFHIDAAYGGFFNLLDQCKPLLKGIERSQSIAIDPHKGLFCHMVSVQYCLKILRRSCRAPLPCELYEGRI